MENTFSFGKYELNVSTFLAWLSYLDNGYKNTCTYKYRDNRLLVLVKY